MQVLCKALSATLRIESSAEISYISLLSIVIPTPTELMHGIFTVPTYIATQRGNQARTWNKYPSFIKIHQLRPPNTSYEDHGYEDDFWIKC